MFLNVFNVLLNSVINTITVDAIVFCQSEQHSVLKAVSWSASFLNSMGGSLSSSFIITQMILIIRAVSQKLPCDHTQNNIPTISTSTSV